MSQPPLDDPNQPQGGEPAQQQPGQPAQQQGQPQAGQPSQPQPAYGQPAQYQQQPQQAYGQPAQYQQPPAYGQPPTGPGQPQPPYGQQPGQPAGSSPKKGLAIAALIVGIAALIASWAPFAGVVLAVIGVILGILAMVKKQPKGLGLTGLILSAVAFVIGLIVTIMFVVAIVTIGTAVSELEITDPEIVEPFEPETDDPAETDEDPAATFREVSESELAAIFADSDAYIGEMLTIYGEVDSFVAFESGGGEFCGMNINAGATPQANPSAYELYAIGYSGDWNTDCPIFEPLYEGDNVKFSVVLLGEEHYTNSDGSTGHAPQLEVFAAELIN